MHGQHAARPARRAPRPAPSGRRACARDRPSTAIARDTSSAPSSSTSAPASTARPATGPSRRAAAAARRPPPGRSRTGPGRVGPAAEEQAEPGHDHRLAGAGLAGHHGQARAELERDVLDDAEAADTDLVTARRKLTTPGVRTREPSTGSAVVPLPRRPGNRSTGRPNFATSRSVNGSACVRAMSHRTGSPAPHGHPRAGRQVEVRRPSQPSTPSDRCRRPSIATVESGAITSGRANSACALIGTTSSACTSGQTTGPPAENAYAVEPVGAAHTTPSQPKRDSGRPSTSMTHLEHPLAGALLHRRLVERPVAGDHLLRRARRSTSRVSRSSTL